MVTISNSNPYGPLHERQLRGLEQRLEAELPSDYRVFLLEHNGGSPEPSGFWIVEGSDGSGVYEFYGLHDQPEGISLDELLNPDETGIPNGLLAIGNDGCSDQICIGIRGEARGAVFFIDHEIHPHDMADSLEGITRLAGSFTEFLANLTEIPD